MKTTGRRGPVDEGAGGYLRGGGCEIGPRPGLLGASSRGGGGAVPLGVPDHHPGHSQDPPARLFDVAASVTFPALVAVVAALALACP